MTQATLQYTLNVLATNMMIVPGCEPTSELTSDTLSRALDCGRAVVNVYDALAAIPGSTIKFMPDASGGGTRRKIFVLPPIDLTCPCAQYDDYYKILKMLAKEEAPVQESYDHCDIIGQGFCHSPDWDQQPTPPPDPYFPEGDSPVGGGFLTFPPLWNGAPRTPLPDAGQYMPYPAAGPGPYPLGNPDDGD